MIDQLLSESRNGYSASYTYDANGNRASKTLNGVTQTYLNDAGDKLTSVLQGVTPVKSFTYDAAGRTTAISESGVVTNFAYDYEDRITQITRSGMATNTFSYNGFGARVSAVDSLGTRTFARNGVGVTSPVLGDGMANYTPGISERRGGVTSHLFGDCRGTTRRLATDETVSGSKVYDAFGNVTASSGTWAGPYGASSRTGVVTENDTGLLFAGKTFIDPTTGRWMTRRSLGATRSMYAADSWIEPQRPLEGLGIGLEGARFSPQYEISFGKQGQRYWKFISTTAPPHKSGRAARVMHFDGDHFNSDLKRFERLNHKRLLPKWIKIGEEAAYKTISRGLVVAGLTIDLVNVYTAPPGKRAFPALSAIGALALGGVCTAAGAVFGAPAAVCVGAGIAGAAIGGYLGGVLCEWLELDDDTSDENVRVYNADPRFIAPLE